MKKTAKHSKNLRLKVGPRIILLHLLLWNILTCRRGCVFVYTTGVAFLVVVCLLTFGEQMQMIKSDCKCAVGEMEEIPLQFRHPLLVLFARL